MGISVFQIKGSMAKAYGCDLRKPERRGRTGGPAASTVTCNTAVGALGKGQRWEARPHRGAAERP